MWGLVTDFVMELRKPAVAGFLFNVGLGRMRQRSAALSSVFRLDIKDI
jgi:hypothetical protein